MVHIRKSTIKKCACKTEQRTPRLKCSGSRQNFVTAFHRQQPSALFIKMEFIGVNAGNKATDKIWLCRRNRRLLLNFIKKGSSIHIAQYCSRHLCRRANDRNYYYRQNTFAMNNHFCCESLRLKGVKLQLCSSWKNYNILLGCFCVETQH